MDPISKNVVPEHSIDNFMYGGSRILAQVKSPFWQEAKKGANQGNLKIIAYPKTLKYRKLKRCSRMTWFPNRQEYSKMNDCHTKIRHNRCNSSAANGKIGVQHCYTVYFIIPAFTLSTFFHTAKLPKQTNIKHTSNMADILPQLNKYRV